MKPQIDTKNKIEQIIQTHSRGEAIVRLNGFFRDFFWDRHLREEMARLYLEKQDYAKAGKFLYFIILSNNENEQAIMAFEESCGFRYSEIWKRLVVESKPPRGIDHLMRARIFQLISNIKNQEGELPIQIVRWLSYYDHIRKLEIQNNCIVDEIQTPNDKDQIESRAQIERSFAQLQQAENFSNDEIERITGLDLK